MKLKDILFMLLAHHPRENLSHTIRIPIGKRAIYLCARCSAIYSALLVSFLIFANFIDLRLLPTWSILIIALTVGTPVIIAWGKQTLTGRDNSNKTRILTGIGGGIGLTMLFYLPSPDRELMIVGIFGLVFLILYFGKIRPMKRDTQVLQTKMEN